MSEAVWPDTPIRQLSTIIRNAWPVAGGRCDFCDIRGSQDVSPWSHRGDREELAAPHGALPAL